MTKEVMGLKTTRQGNSWGFEGVKGRENNVIIFNLKNKSKKKIVLFLEGLRRQ